MIKISTFPISSTETLNLSSFSVPLHINFPFRALKYKLCFIDNFHPWKKSEKYSVLCTKKYSAKHFIESTLQALHQLSALFCILQTSNSSTSPKKKYKTFNVPELFKVKCYASHSDAITQTWFTSRWFFNIHWLFSRFLAPWFCILALL